MRKFFSLAALGVVTVFLALPTPASARPYSRCYGGWGPRYNIGHCLRFYRYRWGPRCYYGDYYYPTFTYYPLNSAAELNTATIRMRVPGDARVWFEGDATSQKGTDREYTTPALERGLEYVYHVRVLWEENNNPVEITRDIKVRAGDLVNFAPFK
jgi:uncharacterized protein (TIGR03000 family)